MPNRKSDERGRQILGDSVKRALAVALNQSGLSKRALARALGIPESCVTRTTGEQIPNLSLHWIADAMGAMGYEVAIQLRKRAPTDSVAESPSIAETVAPEENVAEVEQPT